MAHNFDAHRFESPSIPTALFAALIDSATSVLQAKMSDS